MNTILADLFAVAGQTVVLTGDADLGSWVRIEAVSADALAVLKDGVTVAAKTVVDRWSVTGSTV